MKAAIGSVAILAAWCALWNAIATGDTAAGLAIAALAGAGFLAHVWSDARGSR